MADQYSLSPWRVGVLGGGQLGRMLMESANRLNIQMNVLDGPNAPAKQISAREGHVNGAFSDPESVKRLAENCDIITTEIEHVNTRALEEVNSSVRVEPSWRTIRIIQDKYAQKKHLEKHGIPMAAYKELQSNTPAELENLASELGYPLMLKSKTQAYDGRGNFTVRSREDISKALDYLKDRPLYAEKWAKFKMELAVMVIKTTDESFSYPTVETVQEDSICKLVYAPARNVSESLNGDAQELARKVVSGFDGKGAYGVEMFLMEDNSLLLCEVACRVHNSGHYTIDACPLSQFDSHLRAILDLPILEESLEPRQPSIMLNILGGSSPDSHMELANKALSIPNASIHLYGKGAGRPGRKMGHITVTGASMFDAERNIRPLINLSERIRAESLGLPAPKISADLVAGPTPTVAVIMGSDSDLKTLVPGLRLLEELDIQPLVEITSAHRTPEYMAEFSAKAASKGIKVIIAAAGGAAHLPGMAAAHTSLPVIGVPVKGSSLDGVDSLYSIVQMPRGVPVATVGINNSINAALLAARFLGAYDPRIKRKVEGYAECAKFENLEIKGAELKKLGWAKYFDQMS